MSSAGGSRPAPGLLPETSATDLEVAWKEREEEAEELTVSGFHSTALSMRLYSLEIRLKTHICRLLKLSHLPKVCKTHDLSELVILTGLWEELENPANAALRQNWDLLVDFSKLRLNDQRYLPRAMLNPKDLKSYNDALDDSQDGVLAWLSRHP
ncbi:MAG: hypothetical protein ABSH35_10220 [Isosphaeraceae bacterium]|jgi:hypothetical protein